MSKHKLYHDLSWLWSFLSPPEDYEEEVLSFRKQFQLHGIPDGASILHLGSGGGSIDFHLKKYYRVTGIDLSPAMIKQARAINPEVNYRLGDIRHRRLGQTFDAVLLHDAASYMTTSADLLAVYETAAAHLLLGGVMVTPPEELRPRFHQHRNRTTTRTTGEITVTTLELDYDPDPTDNWYETSYIFLIREQDQLSLEVDTHRVGLFHLEEFTQLIHQASFWPMVTEWELSDMPEDDELLLITAIKAKDQGK